VEIEFAHEIRAMVIDGLHADSELRSDLLRAVTLGYELKDFTFAIGQEISGRARGGIGNYVAQEGSDGRAEIGATGGDGFEAFFKFKQAGGLFDKTVSAGLEHFADEHGIFVSGENEDAQIFELLRDAPQKVDAIQAWKLGVEDDQVRFDV